MHLLNKLGDELIKRKRVLLEATDPLAIEDTAFIINERYYKNNIINDEIKNSILNSEIKIPDFEKTLLKYQNFRKDESQIKQEIAIFAAELEKEFELQDLKISKKDMRIGSDLTTINVIKTICLTKQMMQEYVGLLDDDIMYEKVASRCVIPFFILRIKKIIQDVSNAEVLRSNYIKISSSKPYTSDSNENILFDFILEIDINTLEENKNYNETANYVRNAIDYFETYYQEKTI